MYVFLFLNMFLFNIGKALGKGEKTATEMKAAVKSFGLKSENTNSPVGTDTNLLTC